MKPSKIISSLLTGSLMAGSAWGATIEITITGSTAFRLEAYNAIRTLYGNGLQSQNPAPDASGKNQVTWSGTIANLFGTDTVIVRAGYSGSAAGVGSLANAGSVTVLSSANAGDTNTVSKPADLAFSDIFQASTIYAGSGFPALVDTQVGVLPFVFARGQKTPAGVNNITHKLLNAILASGYLPSFQFTGNTNDQSNLGLIGRDAGSGTRATIHADSGYGVFTTSTLGLLNPADGSLSFATTNGYSSGGSVKDALNAASGPAIGYLGLGDGAKVVGSPNAYLTYNGVGMTFDNVRHGIYSLWTYEHLYSRVDVNANAAKFRDALKAQLAADLPTSVTAIDPATMMVSRNTDGAPITP